MSFAKSGTVARVLGAQLCTGCGLCASVSSGAIVMRPQMRGYVRPVQLGPLTRQMEHVIAKSCPGTVVSPWQRAPNVHPYWGPWYRVATGHATDSALRHQASSGGAVSALAIYALESGKVDRVIHVRADPDWPTRNVVTCSTTQKEIMEGSGSRYSSSSPLATIDQALSDGGRLAFIGKPCDVSALRQFALLDGRVDEHVPLMLSFFCAGIPSFQAADRVVAAMGVDAAELATFRYRGNGWPGSAAATTQDGRTVQMSYADSWGGYLSKELQFRCKICPDAVGARADVACADAWYGDADGYPSFEEHGGRSLIITRTEAGESLLSESVLGGAIEMTSLAIDEVDAMQPGQAMRKRLCKARTAALAISFHPVPRAAETLLDQASMRASFGERARAFLGTMRRRLFPRRETE